MVRHYVRRNLKQPWAKEYLQLAINDVKSNNKSIRSTAKIYGIPQSTLHCKLKRGISNHGMGRPMTFSSNQEKELVDIIKEISSIYQGITREDFKKFAFLYAEKKKIYHTFSKKDKKAGSDWFYKFLKRNPSLSVFKAKRLNGSITEDISDLFDETFKNMGLSCTEELSDENIEIKEEKYENDILHFNTNSEENSENLVYVNIENEYDDIFINEFDIKNSTENNVCAEILNEEDDISPIQNSLESEVEPIENNTDNLIFVCRNCNTYFRKETKLKKHMMTCDTEKNSRRKQLNFVDERMQVEKANIVRNEPDDCSNAIETNNEVNFMHEKYESFMKNVRNTVMLMNKENKLTYIESVLKSELLKKELINLKLEFLNKLSSEYVYEI